MDTFPSDSSNYTPLNLQRFKQDAEKSKRRFHLTDGLLMLSVMAFFLSISYYVGTTRLSTNSQAAHRITPIVRPQGSNVKYPKTYKGERIPQTTFIEVKNSLTGVAATEKDAKAKDIVMRFYVYKDILAENELPSDSAIDTSKSIQEQVISMEQVLTENLLSSADFGYVHARFKFASNEAELQEKYGNLEDRAKSLIDRYVELFSNSEYTVKQIIDVANKDEELTMLNEGRENLYLEDYNSTQNVWSEDKKFHEFLFNLEPKKISELYTLKVDGDKPFAFLVAYVDKITEKKYYSTEQMIEEKIKEFVY